MVNAQIARKILFISLGSFLALSYALNHIAGGHKIHDFSRTNIYYMFSVSDEGRINQELLGISGYFNPHCLVYRAKLYYTILAIKQKKGGLHELKEIRNSLEQANANPEYAAMFAGLPSLRVRNSILQQTAPLVSATPPELIDDYISVYRTLPNIIRWCGDRQSRADHRYFVSSLDPLGSE